MIIVVGTARRAGGGRRGASSARAASQADVPFRPLPGELITVRIRSSLATAVRRVSQFAVGAGAALLPTGIAPAAALRPVLVPVVQSATGSTSERAQLVGFAVPSCWPSRTSCPVGRVAGHFTGLGLAQQHAGRRFVRSPARLKQPICNCRACGVIRRRSQLSIRWHRAGLPDRAEVDPHWSIVQAQRVGSVCLRRVWHDVVHAPIKPCSLVKAPAPAAPPAPRRAEAPIARRAGVARRPGGPHVSVPAEHGDSSQQWSLDSSLNTRASTR